MKELSILLMSEDDVEIQYRKSNTMLEPTFQNTGCTVFGKVYERD